MEIIRVNNKYILKDKNKRVYSDFFDDEDDINLKIKETIEKNNTLQKGDLVIANFNYCVILNFTEEEIVLLSLKDKSRFNLPKFFEVKKIFNIKDFFDFIN